MKKILFISLLALLMSCNKDDNEMNQQTDAQYFIGTWEHMFTTSSFEIRISAGPTVTSFTEVPAPGYHVESKYSITSSQLVENKLIFVAVYKTEFGDVLRECTCTLESKDTLKVLHVLKISNEIRGAVELLFIRKAK